ncbi:MAG: tetratricopeptide repeat protein [Myxococcota bacterium]
MGLLVPLLVLPLAAAAAPRQPVVAVLPVRTASPELARLGLLVEARANALLLGSKKATVLDMKQVLAMAGQEGFDPATLSDEANADRARVLLGADVVVAVELLGDAKGFTVQGTVRDGKQPVPFAVATGAAWSVALVKGSDAVARAALGAEASALPADAKAQPASKSDAALESLGACWETALKQPLGIDAPVGLSQHQLDAAVAACRAALKADPGLRFAEATLALMLAIGREDAEAEKLLGAKDATDEAALVPWALARFWLATRNQSNDAAEKFLASVLAKAPGALMFRSFRAGTLSAMNEHARAAAAWNEYLALSPASAFAHGRLSRSLARQGQYDQALAAAKKGLALTPDSREARLVLAARQQDAGKLNDARKTLEPLVSGANPPAEPLLQLGHAYLAANDLKAAAPLFQAAADRATGPRAGRTRGRALLGLALVEAKRGRADAAKAAFAKSLETGYRSPVLEPELAALVKDVDAKSGDAAVTAGGLYVSVAPLEAAPALPPTAGPLAERELRDKLATFGVAFAPDGEDKKTAVGVIRAKGLKGYQLKLALAPGANEKALEVNLLVMSYPEQALKGNWSVKASGGKPEKLIHAMVWRVVDDAAGDLDWKN